MSNKTRNGFAALTRGALLSACACLVFCQAAHAHKMKLFATSEGNSVSGYVYFVGGGRAQDMTVTVTDPAGQTLAEVTTDDEGAFSFEASEPVDHTFTAESADGHAASFTVSAADLGFADTNTPAAPTSDDQEPAAAVAAPADAEALEQIVRHAVAQQVNPLREQLDAFEAKRRFQDILGGVGYIFGVIGLALYWRRPKGKSS